MRRNEDWTGVFVEEVQVANLSHLLSPNERMRAGGIASYHFFSKDFNLMESCLADHTSSLSAQPGIYACLWLVICFWVSPNYDPLFQMRFLTCGHCSRSPCLL